MYRVCKLHIDSNIVDNHSVFYVVWENVQVFRWIGICRACLKGCGEDIVLSQWLPQPQAQDGEAGARLGTEWSQIRAGPCRPLRLCHNPNLVFHCRSWLGHPFSHPLQCHLEVCTCFHSIYKMWSQVSLKYVEICYERPMYINLKNDQM